jgi:hypothetical protein
VARTQVRSGAVNAATSRPVSRKNAVNQAVRTAVRSVRDEEAAGSNPATPTRKYQVDGMITRSGDHAIDHSLAARWRDRTPQHGMRRRGLAENATV